MKSTKIVCTIGPQSHNEGTLTEMAHAGMNIIRMNFSHGSYDFHQKTIAMTRKVSEKLGKYIGILLDLQGPKIRTGKLKKETVILNKGEVIGLTSREVEGNWRLMSVNYKNLPKEVKKGEKILLDDGNIELRVIGVSDDTLQCKIINGGPIRQFRGINLPDSCISISAVTEKDESDLTFGLENGVDFVALSFVRKADDIVHLRELMEKRGKVLPIIAKIEKPEALENIDEIISVSDGIMVARGDLGAETSPQDVPILQKRIIRKCNLSGKPVITATQMLESMLSHPRPTRAEAADVANAIFDGTDAVMLSGETAVGEYPVHAVRVMSDIAERAEMEIGKVESQVSHTGLERHPEMGNIADSVAFSAKSVTDLIKPEFIISFTLTGKTAALVSKYRPSAPIIAMSPNVEVLRRLAIFWGVYGFYIEHVSTTEEMLDKAEEILIRKRLCREGDIVLIIGGVPVLAGEPTNMMKIHKLKLGEKNI